MPFLPCRPSGRLLVLFRPVLAGVPGLLAAGGQFHKGLDITNRIGTPIIVPAQGIVTLSGRDGAYGFSVEINHGSGIVTKYGHMQRCAVQEGQWVKRGEIVGYVGMSGRTTGPHLHYEVRLNGVPVDPMRYILE